MKVNRRDPLREVRGKSIVVHNAAIRLPIVGNLPRLLRRDLRTDDLMTPAINAVKPRQLANIAQAIRALVTQELDNCFHNDRLSAVTLFEQMPTHRP